MGKDYLRWSKVPYAGEMNPPTDPVTPLAGSWPLAFLKRDEGGNFADPKGRRLRLPITHPNRIDFDRELLIVKDTLKNLTPKQKKIGIYYGTGAPTKQWTPVIDRLIDTYGVAPTEAARILASVHDAINDTLIVVWELKYGWDVARPNQYDPTMKTLICTPRFPTYPSGHAAISGCAQVVLNYFFPREAKKLQKIANDDANSRLYAGVHFPIDNSEGLRLGRSIGNVIVNQLKSERNSDSEYIDHPYRDNLNADILPDNYKQYIPYDFPESCTSPIIKREKRNNTRNHIKPLLFL
ncbi:vanadium-dependent haloperoxidase [Alkalihalobacillus sp. AL-G]|uniref:vanadium-dependent haloperoxidase n=1 Tax=Alkalihalobacillus sp. AL-G TaxID=2926399 RepID=UPI00272D6DB4|nr:vanadium-dependent haloperoxidase [Alkalihalobacillus sp. AL-G]WLD94512.1 vanadium-dependent haloperoxidase [Alkalihalobacillus sp. AL-G]